MYSDTVTKLINQFEKLPGIGHKTAIRLAFYILEAPKEVAEEMSKVLVEAKNNVKFCHKGDFYGEIYLQSVRLHL